MSVNIVPASRAGSTSCALMHDRRRRRPKKKAPAADASGGAQPPLHALDALCPRSTIARWKTLVDPLLRVDGAGRFSFCSLAAIRT
jgi:hypothetical protein